MKVAVAQFNPTVGAIEENLRKMERLAEEASAQGAELLVFPELAIVGYPPRDLLDRPGFVQQCDRATQGFIERLPGNLVAVFGTVARQRASGQGASRAGLLRNRAVVARRGERIAHADKQLLPTYDVFDEARHFEPGERTVVVELLGRRVAVTICEDAWAHAQEVAQRYTVDPIEELRRDPVDLVLNLSASPFTSSKWGRREEIFQDVARECGAVVVVANQVGGNDELIFDGGSVVWAAGGDRLLARARGFEEELLLVDTDSSEPGSVAPRGSALEAAADALVLGVRDYVRKCGFDKVVLGLSGGIDSAVTAVIAADAVGPDNVLGIAMPSRYSSEGSLTDARQLSENLGIGYDVVDIDPVFQAYLTALEPALAKLGGGGAGDVSLENLQARARGATLMALSNRSGALVLTTGNKSEVAVGYCTLYGDMVGALSVISDVPKTMVYQLAHHFNRGGERIPPSSIVKPPSAELRPDQKDEDSLPPYEVLDRVLELYVEDHLSPGEIVRRGIPAETVGAVVALVQRAEYKRKQAAPGLIVTRKAFGPGRRVPVASRFREELGDDPNGAGGS